MQKYFLFFLISLFGIFFFNPGKVLATHCGGVGSAGTSYHASGKVVDTTGRGIPGIQVTFGHPPVAGSGAGGVTSGTTDGSGNFNLGGCGGGIGMGIDWNVSISVSGTSWEFVNPTHGSRHGTYPDSYNPNSDRSAAGISFIIQPKTASSSPTNTVVPPPAASQGEICGLGETELARFAGKMFGCGLGLIGGVALLSIIYGGFVIITSTGNPSRIQVGKEYITYAIAGLLLAIFTFVILEVIGIDILHLPGFSK